MNHIDKLGYTPLHWAANVDYDDSVVVKSLLEAGPDPYIRNKEGLTALQITTQYGHMRQEAILKQALASKAELSH